MSVDQQSCVYISPTVSPNILHRLKNDRKGWYVWCKNLFKNTQDRGPSNSNRELILAWVAHGNQGYFNGACREAHPGLQERRQERLLHGLVRRSLRETKAPRRLIEEMGSDVD